MKKKLLVLKVLGIGACLFALEGTSQGQISNTPFTKKDSTGLSVSFLYGLKVKRMVFGKLQASTAYDDLLIAFTDNSTSTNDSVALYKNDGVGNFSWFQTILATNVLKNVGIAWSKKGGNILVTGQDQSTSAYVTKLYAKNGSGVYAEVPLPVGGTSALAGTASGNVFGDFNGDGKDDIVLWNGATGESHVYLSGTDNQSYSEVANPVDGTATFPLILFNGTWETSITVFDYNKDGKSDILVAGRVGSTGSTNDVNVMTRIYKSNGDGTFTYQIPTLDGTVSKAFQGLAYGSISAGDIDGDGYATDILIEGNSNAASGTTARNVYLYKQDATDPNKYTTLAQYPAGSTGQYTQAGGKRYGQVFFADLDGDGKVNDFITAGQTTSGYVSTDVFVKLPAPYQAGTYGYDSVYRVYSRYGSARYGIDQSKYNNITYDYASNANYRYYASGDINGDGKADLAKWGYNSATSFVAAIYYYDESTLPVTFGKLSAALTGKTVLLKWNTLTEANSASFAIEHSADGKNYTSIGTLAAAGNSNKEIVYTYTDEAPLIGTNYYRIKEADLDGKVTYSNLATAVVKGMNGVSVYPNPVKKGALITVKSLSAVTIKVSDLTGKLIVSQLSQGSTTISTFGLSSGLYFVSVYDVVGNLVSSSKVVVE